MAWRPMSTTRPCCEQPAFSSPNQMATSSVWTNAMTIGLKQVNTGQWLDDLDLADPVID